MVFSRMRSEGFPFIVWGSGVVVGSLIPCLWGKLQNLSFSKVSTPVVMSFNVAGVALCDIPTCLIPCRKCQNWRKSRTKCSFWCAHVSRLESLLFLWRRRVYRGSCKTVSCLESLLFLWRRRVYGGSCQNLVRFAEPSSPCLWGKLQNLSLCFSSGVAVPIGEAAKPRSFCCVQSLLFLDLCKLCSTK